MKLSERMQKHGYEMSDWEEVAQLEEEYETLKAATEELTVVFDEIKCQDDKWGEQRTHPPEWWYPILGEEFGELGKAMLENHFDYPDADLTDIKKELVQVIAVGIQWLKGIAYAGSIGEWMMSETKPDCYCTLQDLKNLTVMPFGWVMIRRSEGGVSDLEDFEIKILGGVDPLAENAALKRDIEKYRLLIIDCPECYETLKPLHAKLTKKDALLADAQESDSE